jgi:hypothetical protein
MPTAPDPAVAALLNELSTGIQTALGDRLAGLYLYGSLVWGDFDPAISDVDLLAVTASTLDETALDGLRAMHDAFAARHPAWDDRIEVAYVPAAGLATFRTEASPIAVISPGEPFHVKPAGRDWLVNWYLVREAGRTLYGPPPSAFIGPIAHEEYIQVVREHAAAWPVWVEDATTRGAQAYAILTLCRALYTVHHGMQPSKRQAAVWAAAYLPEWADLIRQALVWRTTPADSTADPAATLDMTRRFVAAVAAHIASLP